MKPTSALAIVTFLASALSPCARCTEAPSRTVFGLELGTKFELPECPRAEGGFYRDGKSPCYCYGMFREGEGPIPVENGEITIRFPGDQKPSMVVGIIAGLVINHKLEAVKFPVMGVRHAEINIDRLREKYGEPSDITRRPMQNGFGATFDHTVAIWIFSDLLVTFDCGGSKIDSGEVVVETRRGFEFRKEKTERSLKGSRPL